MRVAGIPVVVDPSWLIIALLVTWVLFAELAAAENTTGFAVEAALAVAGALAFFGCLLAHELSHSVVARRRGIGVRRVRLFVFGGVSEIEAEASRPRDELAITAAGPAASVALGAAFLLVAWAVPATAGPVDDVLELLAVVNVALAVFNLLPGFPLDGGRLVRALAWRVTGDFERATVIAVAGGRLIAALLALGGVALVVLARDVAGVWWLAIGWFLWTAAGRSLVQLRVEHRLAGVAVSDLMAPAPRAVSPETPLGVLAGSPASGYAPVVAGGRVRGVVDLDFVRTMPPAERAGWSAGDVQHEIRPADVVDAGTGAREALAVMRPDRPLIVVRDGRMVGFLTRRSIDHWMASG